VPEVKPGPTFSGKLAWPFPGWAAGRWSRSAGHSGGTPRTDPASRAFPDPDPACPSRRHTACTGYAVPPRSWRRFYNMA
jgi:hypothetical protein